MKKKITAFSSVIVALALLLCSCAGGKRPSETTGSLSLLKIDGGVLLQCAGQADENGVYVVPDEVTEIGEGAFSNDTTAKKIVIGKNVKKIDAAAFYGNSVINEIVFEDESVISIGGGAFIGCTSIKSITLPEGLKTLGPYAFYHCTSLESVHLPDSLTEIYSYTFSNCTSLSSVSIPDGVTKIGTAAFYMCGALSEIKLPKSLAEVDEAAFAGCSSITSLDFSGTSVKSLGDSAFVSCTGMKSVIFPDTLEIIGEQTFFNCSSLYNLTLSENLNDIGAFALNFTPWYAEIDDDYRIVGDGVLIKLNVLPEKIDLSEKGIKSIGSSAFWAAGEDSSFEGYEYGADNGYKYASSLSSVVIPEGVVSIGEYAFAGCSIEKISLPSTLENIGDYAFNAVLKGSENIDFSTLVNLKTIGERAFSYCDAVKEINLPMSVDKIGAYAFFKTTAMENFLEKARATESDEDDFWVSGNGVLLLSVVNTGEDEITVPNGIKIIAGGAFGGWNSGVIYDSNEGITDKYWYNAWNVDKVKNIILPDGVKMICDGAFSFASSLENVNIPDSVEYIGDEAFLFCSKLSEIKLGKGVKTVGYRAFAYSAVKEFYAETVDVLSFGDEVFYGCESLVYAVLPQTLSSVGRNLLLGCSSFENICIPRSFEPRIYEIIGNDLYASPTRNAFNISYYE